MQRINRILFILLALVIFNDADLHAYPSLDSSSVKYGFAQERIRIKFTLENKLESFGEPNLIVSRNMNVSADSKTIETDALTDADEEKLEDSDDEFDKEFEDEFGEVSESQVFDPLSGYNRIMTNVNDKIYFWALKPVARGYRYVVPEGIRRGVVRFFNNLLFPVRFINNVLQLKIKNAGEEIARFGLNTTVGILGFWDPAKDSLGLEPHPEDFGQTLGRYGAGSGFHIVLPVLGPSNLRDLIGLVPDYLADPVSLVETDLDEFGVRIFDEVNDTSLHIGEYESTKKD
ncbi:MAG: VacJ family lipoprotein, partial [Desulfobacterales bacterium]